MKIGSHVSNNGQKMLLGSVEEALSYGANCFMLYLGAPQNTFRKKVFELRINEMHDLMYQHGLKKEDVIVHAPYIVNLAQPDDDKWQFAIDFLTREMILASSIGVKYIVIHPGAHVGMGSNWGIRRIALGIKKMIENTLDLDVIILLETMAGKGTECGKTFEEINELLALINEQSRTGVCLDTCHIHDAGYDLVNDYEGVWNFFNQIIGLDMLKVIHLNDSKNPRGASKDRHENIGFGYLGFETLKKVAFDERFSHIPKILETPYVGEGGGIPPYKEEIAMLKNKCFDLQLKTKILVTSKSVS